MSASDFSAAIAAAVSIALESGGATDEFSTSATVNSASKLDVVAGDGATCDVDAHDKGATCNVRACGAVDDGAVVDEISTSASIVDTVAGGGAACNVGAQDKGASCDVGAHDKDAAFDAGARGTVDGGAISDAIDATGLSTDVI